MKYRNQNYDAGLNKLTRMNNIYLELLLFDSEKAKASVFVLGIA